MKEKTVRELVGEVWAEITQESLKGACNIQVEDLNIVVDICLGVLARHTGCVIKNDKDLPVAPLSANSKAETQ
jgi:hypothetical protein